MKRFFLLALLLFSGCAQLPPLPPTPANQLESWRLNGRLAISTQDDSWTANVYWQQNGPAYQLRLNMPLGQGALLLEGNDKEVVMRTANNETFTAPDADALVAKVLNVAIPVTNLHFWIRGIPTPKSSLGGYTLNEVGQLQSLQQDGWEIVFQRYVNVHGIHLPKKIILENNSFKVKIVISQWNITKISKLPPKPLRVQR